MQHEISFSENPALTAKALVAKNGLEHARQIAMEGTTAANEHGDLYRLSVWREVKGILGKWAGKAAYESSNSVEIRKAPSVEGR